MASQKRKRSELSLLNEELPIQDTSLYQETIFKLRESLEDHRNKNDKLLRKNILLCRQNECLNRLFSGVASLWDTLNVDLEKYILDHNINSQGKEFKKSNKFWDNLTTSRLPFISSVGPSLTGDNDSPDYSLTEDPLSFENTDNVYDDEYMVSNSEWEEVRNELVQTSINVFSKKKDELLRSIRYLFEDIPQLEATNMESKMDSNLLCRLESEREKVKVLTYTCLNYFDHIKLWKEKYKSLRKIANHLEIEISRLTQQNATLRLGLKSRKQGEKEDGKQSSCEDVTQTPVSSTLRGDNESDSDGMPVPESVQPTKVNIIENVEEVTDEMVIGSSLYSKLFNHSKSIDEELKRLEKENVQLRSDIANSWRDSDSKYYEFVERYERLNSSLMKRMEENEAKMLSSQQELLVLKDNHDGVLKELEEIRKERDSLLEDIQEKDRRLINFASQNAKICREFALSGPEGSADSPELSACREQLLNISEELEEISNAFEEKQHFCDDLMRQIKENSVNKERVDTMQANFKSMQDRLNKVISLCDTKLVHLEQQHETLERSIKTYRNSWFHAYKRSVSLEQQRDHAYSAMCELQLQYRKSSRTQKELQSYISQLKSVNAKSGLSTAGANVPPDSHTDLDHIVRENEELRRRMTCNVCCESFRNYCITKCGHVFCNDCLTNNIKSRNRKCPHCKITFDRTDVRRIFLD